MFLEELQDRVDRRFSAHEFDPTLPCITSKGIAEEQLIRLYPRLSCRKTGTRLGLRSVVKSTCIADQDPLARGSPE